MVVFHQSYFTFRHLIFLTAAVFVLSNICGCSQRVIGIPCLRETWMANPSSTGGAVRYQGWGICVDTHSLEGGITFGSIDKTYFFPGPASARSMDGIDSTLAITTPTSSKSPDLHTLEPLTDPVRKAEIQAHAQSSAPIGVRSSFAGISLQGNPHRVGIALGFQRRSALVLDPAKDTLVIWLNAPATTAAPANSPVTGTRSQLHLLTFTKESHP